MSLLLTAAELAAMVTVDDVLAWAGLVGSPAWVCYTDLLGGVPTLRVVAVMPAATVQMALVSCRVPTIGGDPRTLNAVEVAQISLAMRAARAALALPDIDFLAVPGPPAAAPPPAAPGPPPGAPRRVKFSMVLNQADEGEIPPLDQPTLDQMYVQLQTIKGALPLPEADPSPDQVSALRVRVLEHQDTPYADFALFTPYNLRFLKALKFKSYVLEPDGTFRMVEVPGPPNWDAWYASWRVFANVLLMLTVNAGGMVLPIVTPAALEEYLEQFRSLCSSLPETWHLCVMAEDRCRAEHFAQLRRLRAQAYALGGAPGYNPLVPWDDVFRQAALDKSYWDRHVRDPALVFMARGGARKQNTSPATDYAASPARTPTKRARRTAAARGKIAELQEELKNIKSHAAGSTGGTAHGGNRKGSKGGGKQQSHPRKDSRGHFVTTREGTQICFGFSAGTCAGTCKAGRAHVCQQCLGAHRTPDCPQGGRM